MPTLSSRLIGHYPLRLCVQAVIVAAMEDPVLELVCLTIYYQASAQVLKLESYQKRMALEKAG